MLGLEYGINTLKALCIPEKILQWPLKKRMGSRVTVECIRLVTGVGEKATG